MTTPLSVVDCQANTVSLQSEPVVVSEFPGWAALTKIGGMDLPLECSSSVQSAPSGSADPATERQSLRQAALDTATRPADLRVRAASGRLPQRLPRLGLSLTLSF